MKFLFIFFLISFFSFTAAQDYPYSEEAENIIGLSLTGSLKISNSISLSHGFETKNINTSPGYALGIEYYVLKGENRNAGAGFEYQFNNKVFGLEGSFQNLPLYLFYEFSVVRIKYIVLPFIHLQLGYNFLLVHNYFLAPDISAENGLYYAFGFSSGITKNLKARLTYSSSLGKLNYFGESWFFSNNKINLTLALVL